MFEKNRKRLLNSGICIGDVADPKKIKDEKGVM
jgi:hypothetical protein